MWFFWVLGALCLVVLIFVPALDKDLKHKRKADYFLEEVHVLDNKEPHDTGGV